MALCCLAVLTVPATCNRDDRSPTTTRATRPDPQPAVHAFEPAPPTINTELRLIGKISYGEDYYSKVSSPVQGRVVEVRATLGQHVKNGDVLLVIDSPDITAAYSDFLKEISELEFATRSYNLAKDLL